MPDHTQNLGLVKPLLAERYDVGVFNENADKIDTAFGEMDSRLFPVGSVRTFGHRLNNPDWIDCDGRSLNIPEYGELLDNIGMEFSGELLATTKRFDVPKDTSVGSSTLSITASCWTPELGKFFAVGRLVQSGPSSSRVSIWSSADGELWQLVRNWNDNVDIGGIAWSSPLGTLVIAGNLYNSTTGGRATWIKSTDGISFGTNYFNDENSHINDLIWVNELGVFVAVGSAQSSSTALVYTSANGSVWTEVYRGADSNSPPLRTVSWSPELGMLIAGGGSYAGNTKMLRSFDGSNWSVVNAPGGTQPIGSSCWSPELGKFVFMATGGGRALLSSDGSTWKTVYFIDETLEIPHSIEINDVVWSSDFGLFVAVGRNTLGDTVGRMYTSPDGETWTMAYVDMSSSRFYSVAYSPVLKRFIFVGNSTAVGIDESFYTYDTDGKFAVPDYNSAMRFSYIRAKVSMGQQ